MATPPTGQQVIHVDDLAEPVLSPAQRDVLDLMKDFGELDLDALLRRAARKAGTDYFGDPEFLPRAQAQVDAVNADQGQTGLGRFIQQQRMVRLLVQRARLEDLLLRHPEIHDIEIERPLIVVGLPRSGTTHLVNLLAADPRRRSLPYWESQEPFPLPGEGPGADGVDPRYLRSRSAYDSEADLTPLVAAMHDRHPGSVEEEVELLDLDFAAYCLEWHARVPGWRDQYYELDQDQHYAYLRTTLKALTFLRGPRSWVLKSPQHLENIGPLIRTFPDATVAFTHRDPLAVVQSAATMLAYGDRMRRTEIDAPALGAYWVDRIERLLRCGVRDRDLVPAEQSLDISFHHFMRDDLATVDRIYALAGSTLEGSERDAVTGYLAENGRGSKGRLVYDLQRDFGISPASVRDRFTFYTDRFDIEEEL